MTTRIIAIVNQKGGVGKTTTAINLAAALVGQPCMHSKTPHQNVVLIDLDPQGNATTGLGARKKGGVKTLYDVLVSQEKLRDVLIETAYGGLKLAPSDVGLSGADLKISTLTGRTKRLKNALHDYIHDTPQPPNFVLIDCPPSLSLLTVNALAAAHAVIVPLQCEFFALEGLSQLLQTVNMVKQEINPSLVVDGIVLTMYDKRNRLSDQVCEDVRAHFAKSVYETVIPRNVRIAEASSFGQSVLDYDAHCAGSLAYQNFAKEVMKKCNARIKRDI